MTEARVELGPLKVTLKSKGLMGAKVVVITIISIFYLIHSLFVLAADFVVAALIYVLTAVTFTFLFVGSYKSTFVRRRKRQS